MNIPDIKNGEVAFGIQNYPDVKILREECKDIPKDKIKKFKGLFNDWFFVGLKKLELIPKPNVDPNKALRYIKSCMVSFSPKHEVKEEVVTCLLAIFFDDVTYEK